MLGQDVVQQGDPFSGRGPALRLSQKRAQSLAINFNNITECQ